MTDKPRWNATWTPGRNSRCNYRHPKTGARCALACTHNSYKYPTAHQRQHHARYAGLPVFWR